MNDVIGVIRRVSSSGHIVIPIEWRRMFGMKEGAKVEILATSEGILIRPVSQNDKR